MGLYYLHARFYDPSTARFMSMDTYAGDQTDPLSLNLYAYCQNNPVIYVDPTGHWQQGDEQYTQEVQLKLIALTEAYYNATTDIQRSIIQSRANSIRQKNAFMKSEDNATAISNKLNEVYKSQKYYDAGTWEETLKDSNIVVEKAPNTRPDDYLAYSVSIQIGFINVIGDNGNSYYGGYQKWYYDDQAWNNHQGYVNTGCGPVAAANIAMYYMVTKEIPNYFYDVNGNSVSQKDYKHLMNIMYEKIDQRYIPYIPQPILTMDQFVAGMEKYMKANGVDPNSHKLYDNKANASEAGNFISEALLGENPAVLLMYNNPYAEDELLGNGMK